MRNLILVLVLLSLALVAIGDETLTGSVVVGVSHEWKSIDGGKTLRDNGALSLQQNFSYGTSTEAAQINVRFMAAYGLKSDTETVIDTQTLAQTYGDDAALSAAKAFAVKNLSLTSTVTVGSSAIDSLFSGSVPPGGALCLIAPYDGFSTATGTGIYLNTDGTASCEVSILGIAP
jgi:hypothetical protein